MGQNRMVWVDLETTGLDVSSSVPIEIGVMITDFEGGYVAAYKSLIHGEELSYTIKSMNLNPEVRDMHTKSGLFEALKSKPVDDRRDFEETEYDVMRFLTECGLESGAYPMCGSTITFDRAFLRYWMPNLHDWFHYRNVDVSTLKNVCKMVNPEVAAKIPAKRERHRVIEDIEDSVAEYKFYLDNLIHVSI